MVSIIDVGGSIKCCTVGGFDRYNSVCDEKMKSRQEIAEDLLEINRVISLYWIGMKIPPTEETIMELNQHIGKIIKELREG